MSTAEQIGKELTDLIQKVVDRRIARHLAGVGTLHPTENMQVDYDNGDEAIGRLRLTKSGLTKFDPQ